jgi:hypothetical protein
MRSWRFDDIFPIIFIGFILAFFVAPFLLIVVGIIFSEPSPPPRWTPVASPRKDMECWSFPKYDGQHIECAPKKAP